MRHKEFWIALGIGAIAGGIAALLYAPQTGACTRKQLKRGLADASDALEEAGDYLKKQAEYLSREAKKLMDDGKDEFEATVDSAAGYVATARKATQNLM